MGSEALEGSLWSHRASLHFSDGAEGDRPLKGRRWRMQLKEEYEPRLLYA